jgi:hypothetical protein
MSAKSTKPVDAPVSHRAIAELWPEFVSVVRSRLEVGTQAYGDASFEAPLGTLAGEIEEELLDVVGWGFILWCRMRALKAKLDGIEARTRFAGPGSPPPAAGGSGAQFTHAQARKTT